MTTAHRPTWKAAVASSSDTGLWSAGGALSTQRSSKDGASHKSLKYRPDPHAPPTAQRQAVEESLRKVQEAERQVKDGGKRALKQLLDAAQQGGGGKARQDVEERGVSRAREQEREVDVGVLGKYDDADDDEEEEEVGAGGGASDDDDDDDSGSESGSGSSDSDSDSDSDDSSSDSDSDEEALLQAELAKIRREREAQKDRDAQAASAALEAGRAEAALLGNPLLQGGGEGASGKIKRRWNDDVVFRNQARGEPEQNKKRFINDTVRNDFHKRFLSKYVN
jgi:protein CWC15